MQINRRHFLTLAGGIAATATLTSCAGTGGAAAPQSGEEGLIKFWSNHPGKSKEIEQKLIDAFVAANPGTKVELVDGGANYEELAQKFNAALTGGDLPDVIVASDVTWFNFALNKAITPLDELWTKVGVKSDDYVDTLREDYALNGKHYAMPYSRSTCLMYYTAICGRRPASRTVARARGRNSTSSRRSCRPATPTSPRWSSRTAPTIWTGISRA